MTTEKIRLQNFRGYSDVPLRLKPLTVLLGANSSGKSSFSQPLAALSHCQSLYEGRRDASLTPRTAIEAAEWPVDLEPVTKPSPDLERPLLRLGRFPSPCPLGREGVRPHNAAIILN